MLPVTQRQERQPDRKVLDNHKVLCGIMVALYTGIRCKWLPAEPGFCFLACEMMSQGPQHGSGACRQHHSYPWRPII